MASSQNRVFMLLLTFHLVVAHYPVYPNRKTTDLSGEWEFGFSNTYNVSIGGPFVFNATQQVPGAWDAGRGPLQYSRGVGFYRKQLDVTAHQPSSLHFEACSLWCRIVVDGEVLHENFFGGYTPFWVRVPPSPKSTRELVVVADNRFDPVLSPTQFKNYDFYQYGGSHHTPAQDTCDFNPTLIQTWMEVSSVQSHCMSCLDPSSSAPKWSRSLPQAARPAASSRSASCWAQHHHAQVSPSCCTSSTMKVSTTRPNLASQERAQSRPCCVYQMHGCGHPSRQIFTPSQ